MKRYSTYKDSGVKWIGEIPSHWETPQAKFLGTVKSGDGITNNELEEDGPYEVWGGNGLMGFSNKHNIGDPKIIIGRVGALCGNIHLSFGKRYITDNALIYSCNSKVDITFLAYAMDGANLNSLNTSSAQPLITGTKVMNTKFPVPPLSEQRTIVSFLDTELGKIDTYVDKEQQLIERLKELKQSVIARAVTRGINPNVRMKPSGVNWIGEIPEHWKVNKIRSIFMERREKVSDKAWSALSVSKEGVLPQLQTAVKTDNGDNRKKVCKGDFVVNSRSDRKGSCGISDYDGSVSLINIVLKPLNIVGLFYHYLFRSNDYIEEFYKNGRGIVADLWTTRYSEMRNIYIPIPPLSEQRAIVDYISSATSKIDKLISEKTKEMEYMKELRQRIISDAVTGKIDVRS